MFNRIVGTIGTRAVSAVLSFLVWILNARLLGPENLGTIGLIIFSIAVIQLIINFFSGAVLIYQTPRVGVYRLMIPAYIWTCVMSILLTAFLVILPYIHSSLELIPNRYAPEVLILTLLMSLATINFNLLLGLEKVRQYNYLSLMQVILLVAFLALYLFVLDQRDVLAYLYSFGISWLITLVAGLLVLRPSVKRSSLHPLRPLIKEILRFGSYVQIANIFQTFNYRLSLKFVDAFLGRAAVGILSVGLVVAEAVWIVGRSIATVQFAQLSNRDDFDYSVKLTLILVKITVVISTIAMAILLFIPESFFELLFTRKFAGLKQVVASLSVGIITLSASIVLSGFFSGINKPRHNTISSAIGFVFTCIFGLVLIPSFGVTGAGIAASASYTAATLYQVMVFVNLAKVKPADFLLKTTEIRVLVGELKKHLA